MTEDGHHLPILAEVEDRLISEIEEEEEEMGDLTAIGIVSIQETRRVMTRASMSPKWSG
jgi:hypothetical protein